MTRRYENFSKYTGRKTGKEVLVETTPDTNDETQSNKENIMENQINENNIKGLIEACMIRVLGRIAESEEDFVKLAQDEEYQQLSKAAMDMAVMAAAEDMQKRLTESGVIDALKEMEAVEKSLQDEAAKILNKSRSEIKTSDLVDAARIEPGIVFGMKMMLTKLGQVSDAFAKLAPEENDGREKINSQLTVMEESIRIIEEQLAAEKAAKAKAQAEAAKAAEAKTQSTNSQTKEKTMENNQNQSSKEQAYEKAEEVGAEMRKAAKEEAVKGFFERHKSALLMAGGALAAVGIGYGIYSFFSSEEAVATVTAVASDAAETVTESAVETTVTAAFANLLK